MEQQNNIKPLLEFYSGVSHPWGMFADILIARHPLFRFVNKARTKIPKVQSRFKEAGFYGYELGLWSGSLFDQEWNIDQDRLSAYSRAENSFHRFHACFEMVPANLKGIFFNIADGQERNIKSLKSQITVAHLLAKEKQTILVVHPGFVAHRADSQKGISAIKKVLDEVLAFAEQQNVIIALENLPYLDNVYFIGADVSELIEIVDEYNSDFLKITFDWGHLNIVAHAENAPDNFAYIDEKLHLMGDRIAHAHLNYNKCCENHWKPSVTFSKEIAKRFSRMLLPSDSFDLFNIEPLDEHMPLTRALGTYRTGLVQNIETLFSVSSIQKHGFVTHEIEPKKIFSIITHKSEGATYIDHKNDLVLLKEVLSKVSAK